MKNVRVSTIKVDSVEGISISNPVYVVSINKKSEGPFKVTGIDSEKNLLFVRRPTIKDRTRWGLTWIERELRTIWDHASSGLL